ncbi:Hypothetical_protein [Hexamita inflata]|uniref:Hypothetical_protein n=1 Tax=Hexamita inflata TaxID=28002 RepID=A0AA86PMG7_9EUKA|nr:Hypothetical protein HINF_LOCUS25780 [Hexamita inflata]
MEVLRIYQTTMLLPVFSQLISLTNYYSDACFFEMYLTSRFDRQFSLISKLYGHFVFSHINGFSYALFTGDFEFLARIKYLNFIICFVFVFLTKQLNEKLQKLKFKELIMFLNTFVDTFEKITKIHSAKSIHAFYFAQEMKALYLVMFEAIFKPVEQKKQLYQQVPVNTCRLWCLIVMYKFFFRQLGYLIFIVDMVNGMSFISNLKMDKQQRYNGIYSLVVNGCLNYFFLEQQKIEDLNLTKNIS